MIGHRIEVDEAGAGVVRRIFTLYLEGQSIAAIARKFNAEHVPPARAKTRHRRKGWVASSVSAVLGQRLLRSICSQCRTPYQPNEALLAELGISRRDIGEKQFYYGKGCDACNNTGYKGRKGIYELLKISDPIRELINERAPTVNLKQKAIELGMVTLRQDGLRSIFAGDTTIEEVIKYT